MEKLITFFLLFPIICFSQEEEVFPYDYAPVPLTYQECNDIEFRTSQIGQKNRRIVTNRQEIKNCVFDFIRNYVKEDLSRFSESGENRSIFLAVASIKFNSEGKVIEVKTRSANEEASHKLKEKLLELPDFIPASNKGRNVGTIISIDFRY